MAGLGRGHRPSRQPGTQDSRSPVFPSPFPARRLFLAAPQRSAAPLATCRPAGCGLRCHAGGRRLALPPSRGTQPARLRPPESRRLPVPRWPGAQARSRWAAGRQRRPDLQAPVRQRPAARRSSAWPRLATVAALGDFWGWLRR